MGQIRAGLIFAGFIAALAIYAPAQALVSLIWPRGARLPEFIFYKAFAAMAGMTVREEGLALSAKGGAGGGTGDRGCLIVANHVSYFDAAALGCLHPMSFVAKTQVAGWPVIGPVAKLSGTVFVDRESRSAARKDKQTIQDRLDRGDTIVLFPEGTSSDGVRVLPFKSALFGAVERPGPVDKKNQVPDFWIQPVSLAYRRASGLPLNRRTRPFYAWYGDMDFVAHMWGAYVQGPFEVVVRFHPPVQRGQFASRKAMAAWCEEVVRRGVSHDLAAKPGAPELPKKPEVGQARRPAAIAAE